jgi:hypothetical protein
MSRPGETRMVGYQWAPVIPGLSRFGSILGGSQPPTVRRASRCSSAHAPARYALHRRLRRADGPTRVYTNTKVRGPAGEALRPTAPRPYGRALTYSCHARQRDRPPARLRGGGRGVTPRVVRAPALRPYGSAARSTARRASAIPRARIRPSVPPRTRPEAADRSLTGNCVPANLVFGFLSDDDMCILPRLLLRRGSERARGAGVRRCSRYA